MADCCGSKKPKPKASYCETGHSQDVSSCCEPKSSCDWFLWSSLSLVIALYGLHQLAPVESLPQWLQLGSHAVVELVNTMWWSVLLAALFVGLIGQVPQQFVVAMLGRGGTFKGILRATAAGVLLDLCSHGILMVGMKLYQKGASLGQVMAFLIASPWNSLSLTLILIALIGLPWTLAFIALSMLIAVISGLIFDQMVTRGTLPGGADHQGLPEGFKFWPEARARWAASHFDSRWFAQVAREGITGSRIVVRWLLFGILLAASIRGLVSLEDFQGYFGPTAVGLVLTLVAATIIEVCSEGGTPIAADLLTRAAAPGNSFAFLMTGVATDYTEVMVIKDTMRSWKIALFLPLVTVPQVVLVALILNALG